jgi:WD40 repeat protein
VIAWDLETGERRAHFRHNDEGVGTVALSPDGCRVLFALSHLGAEGWVSDSTLHVLDVHNGVVRRTPGHSDEVTALAVDGAGRQLVSVSLDYTARVWHVDRLVEGEDDDAALAGEGIAVAPSGRVAVTCWDATVRVIDLDVTITPGRVLRGHTGPVYGGAWLSGDRLVTGGADGCLRVWNANGEVVATHALGAPVDRLVAVGDGDRVIVLQQAALAPFIGEDEGEGGDAREAVADKDALTSPITIVDAASGAVVGRLSLPRRAGLLCEPLAVVGGGAQVLAAVSDRELGVFEAVSGRLRQTLLPSRGQLAGVDVFNGVAFTTDLTGLVRSVDLRTGEVVDVADNGEYTRAVAVSPSGRRVATGCDDGGVRVYERQTGRLLAAWFHPAWVVNVAFRDDDHVVAVLSAGGWRVLALRGETATRLGR